MTCGVGSLFAGCDDTWQDFIAVQVAGRASVDVRGMTGRVEELLAIALARL